MRRDTLFTMEPRLTFNVSHRIPYALKIRSEIVGFTLMATWCLFHSLVISPYPLIAPTDNPEVFVDLADKRRIVRLENKSDHPTGQLDVADLRKSLSQFIRNRLKLPAPLLYAPPPFDTIQTVVRIFGNPVVPRQKVLHTHLLQRTTGASVPEISGLNNTKILVKSIVVNGAIV